VLRTGSTIEWGPWRAKVAAVLEEGGSRFLITGLTGEVPKRVRGQGVTCELALRDPVGKFAAYWADPERSEVTETGSPKPGVCAVHLGDSWVLTEVIDVGRREFTIRLPNARIPRPEDAGAPVAQDERVVGMLYMYFLEDDCVGRAVRIDFIESRLRDAARKLRGSDRERGDL